VFYSTAFSCIVFFVVWLFLAASSPYTSSNLSHEETSALQAAGLVSATCEKPSASKNNAKWQLGSVFDPRIFLHAAAWVPIICNFVQNSQMYFAEWLPFFYNSQLGLSVEDASLHVSMIALVEMPARALTKDMPERLKQGGCSLLQCRKRMSLQGFCFHMVLCSVLASLLWYDVTWTVAFTALFTLTKGVQAYHAGGYFANYLDLTQRYTGMLTGVGNTVASLAGVVVPQFISMCMQSGDKNWLPVFAGLIVINIVAATIIAQFMSTHCLDDSLHSVNVKRSSSSKVESN
jgi:hypothetical protein